MRILLIENLGEDFYKARVPLAKSLIKKGHTVFALVPQDGYEERIRQEGIEVISYPFSRKNKGLIQIIKLLPYYKSAIKKNKIDLIHSFRFQPNLMNVLVNIFSKKNVILHITGLGVSFSSDTLKFRFLKGVSKLIYLFKFLIADKIIVQNPDDIKDFIAHKYFKEKLYLIKGSGVDINTFHPKIKQKSNPLIKADKINFLCVTRLLWEKGLKELTDAFLDLPEKVKSKVNLNIVGWADFDNPRALDKGFIESFENDIVINFPGRRNDIPELMGSSDIYIYPSYYREGIPRSLLEALATGLPVITTDMPGCNLTVDEKKNGFLIKPRSASSIRDIIIKLIDNQQLLSGMGALSRQKAVEEFASDKIFNEIEMLYKK